MQATGRIQFRYIDIFFLFSFSSNSLSGSCNVCLRSSPQSLCNNLVSCLVLLKKGFRSVDSCAVSTEYK